MKTFLLLGAILLTSCTTTTTTSPDGTITTTRRQDPKAIRAIQGAVSTIGAAAAQEAIRQMVEQQNQQ